MTENINLIYLQSTVLAWLKNHEQRPAWLARSAKVNPSILSRFLNGTTALNEVSVLRLYKVMKWQMTSAQREQFLEAAGLRELLSDVACTASPELPIHEQLTTESAFNTGMAYLSAASAAADHYDKVIGLYRAAERSFGHGSTNAAYAAIQIAHNMTMCGDIAGAENEFTRVASVYEGIMDPLTRVSYAETRGYMEFDRADLVASARWHRECLDLAKITGQWSAINDSLSHMILIPLEIANATPDGATRPGVQMHISYAEQALQVFMQHLRRSAFYDENIQSYYLFRAKLRRAQGRYVEAKRDLRQSRELQSGLSHAGVYHTDIEAAEMALATGDTTEARLRVMPAHDVWSRMRYAGGASRATRILATTSLMDGKGSEALELALSAACINPFGTYQDRAKLDAILASARSQVRFELQPRHYKRLITRLRHKAEERQGAFAPLATIAPSPRASLDDIFSRVA